MAARIALVVGLLTALLTACDATDPIEDESAISSSENLPEAQELTKENPVSFIELEGPNFHVVYNPKVVSDDGVLWHSHKNCPDSPPNYAFPVSKPVKLSDGLQRVTMACQYKFN